MHIGVCTPLKNPGKPWISILVLKNPGILNLSLEDPGKLSWVYCSIIPKLFNTVQKERLNKCFLYYMQYGGNISSDILKCHVMS